MQYTIRNVPEYLDAALRRVAREKGESLNEAALKALVRGAGLSEAPRRKRDLSDLFGIWQEDPAFDAAIAAQDTIDEDMWPMDARRRKGSPKKALSAAAARQKRTRKKAAA
jgi:hypothetical protein